MARKTIVLPINSNQPFNRGTFSVVPSAPSLTSLTPGNEQNALIWSPVIGATEYRIFYSTSPGVTTTSEYVSTGNIETTFIHDNIVNGIPVYYKVAAIGAWGVTALSNELTATPGETVSTKSFRFNGADAHIDFGILAHSYERSEAWSFSAWVRPNNIASNQCIWAKATNDSSVHGWIFYINTNGKLYVQVRSSGSLGQHVSANAIFSPQTWVHITVTYAGGSNMNGIKIYVNGVLDSQGSNFGLGSTLLNLQPSRLGVRNTSQRFSGHMDEISFWDKELSDLEVAEIFGEGKPGNLIVHSAASNLRHWYRADGDIPPVVIDHKGLAPGATANMLVTDIQSEVP